MANARSIPPALVLFEDAQVPALAPLSLLRPAHDIKVGVFTLREKLERHLGMRAVSVRVRDHVRASVGSDATLPPPSGDILLVNSRVISTPALASAITALSTGETLFSGGVLVAARGDAQTLGNEGPAVITAVTGTSTEADARLLTHPWDTVRYFREELDADLDALMPSTRRRNVGRVGVAMLKRGAIHIGTNTRVYPNVVINGEAGPVVIGNDCTIMPFVYLEGPCYIGDGTIVKSHTTIAHSSIGPQCRVSGEISGTTMHGYVNKQHEGFIGDSYIAPWVNLGAGTITSNLKNTYGTVRVIRGGVQVDTGMQFLGTIAGDHTKFGINTMLNTGTITGVGCNVYGAGFPDKEIPSFRWGASGTAAFDKFLAVARMVMARRNVELTAADAALLEAVYRTETAQPR